jgi:hypothetical protein
MADPFLNLFYLKTDGLTRLVQPYPEATQPDWFSPLKWADPNIDLFQKRKKKKIGPFKWV